MAITNPFYQFIILLLFILLFIAFIHELGIKQVPLTSWGGLTLESEFDVMQGMAMNFYNELLVPLLIMVNVLMLGLILVIKIILKPEK